MVEIEDQNTAENLQDRPEHGMTKRSYVEAVLEGITSYKHEASKPPSPPWYPHTWGPGC
jgi:hypothetical protein